MSEEKLDITTLRKLWENCTSAGTSTTCQQCGLPSRKYSIVYRDGVGMAMCQSCSTKEELK